jgi:hypothetical protein
MRIPNFLYEINVYMYVTSLVIDGRKTFQSLDDHEKSTLAAYIIHALGDDASDLLADKENLSHFIKFLRSSSKEDAYEFADHLRQIVTNTYSKQLEKLFDEVNALAHSEKMYEAGFYPYKNQQTGETEWRKIA